MNIRSWLTNMGYKFSWVKIYFSPFKPIIPKIYIGKKAIGTPYFLPRKTVKTTPERAHKATQEYIKREENYNKMNPKYTRKIRPYNEVFEEKMRYLYFADKKIGFDFVALGYKTKWSDTDYRQEWDPVWSFVFFKWQIALIFRPKHDCHYWECWLYYTNNTDKTKSTKERIKQARKGFPCTWTSTSKGKEEKINYWNLILKTKYL